MSILKKIWLLSLAIFSSVVFADSIIVKDKSGQAVGNIVVYLQPEFKLNARAVHSDKKQYTVRQKNKKFTPYITVVEKGTIPEFANEDDITHHIYSAVGPERFSFKLKSEKSKSDIKFDKIGHVAMGCNIHDWMSGHILVVGTPFYGLTDEQGKIEFNALPAGNYQLYVWHPQLNAQDNQESMSLNVPLEHNFIVNLKSDLSPIPDQATLDDFEFLEGY